MTLGKPAVLVVDDDASIRQTLAVIIETEGLRALSAETGEQALELCEKEQVDLVLLDVQLPDIYGLQVLEKLQARHPDVGVVLVTVVKEIAVAVEAMKLGALDYLTKDFSPAELSGLLKKVALTLKERKQLAYLKQEQVERSREPMIIGPSLVSRAMEAEAKRAARSTTNVLITGETGSGKQVLAQHVHQNSDRRNELLVTVHVPSLPRDQAEGILFGHAQRSIEGPGPSRLGKFEYADHGTLLLDEVGDLSPDLQRMLLRAVEAKEIVRVGETFTRRVDVRIITTSNRDLDGEVRAGRFRADLLSRLRGHHLKVPPLRERRADIPDLAASLAARFAQRRGGRPVKCSPEALALLQLQPWPENVLELANAIEAADPHAEAEFIESEDLPGSLERPIVPVNLTAEGISYAVRRQDLDLSYFGHLAEKHGADIGAAAREAGLTNRHVRRRYKELGILITGQK